MNETSIETAARDSEILTAPLPETRVGYIVTKEGRAYSEDGLLTLTDKFFEAYPLKKGAAPDSGILWHAGMQVNDIGFMADILAENPGIVIVLSMPDDVRIYNCALDGLGQNLAEYLGGIRDSGRTTWEALYSLFIESTKEADGNG